jgi:hypothetical protein
VPPVLLAGFLGRRAQRCMRQAARSAALFAPSTVIRTGFACTFRGHECGGNHRCFSGRQERGSGGKPGTGPCFSGAGGVPGFPPVNSELFPLLQFVRSGVGGILTSPSCLVEGVRSGSRRRNAAAHHRRQEGMPGRILACSASRRRRHAMQAM